MATTCGSCLNWTQIEETTRGVCRGAPPTADTSITAPRGEQGVLTARGVWRTTEEDELACAAFSPRIPQQRGHAKNADGTPVVPRRGPPDPAPPEPGD